MVPACSNLFYLRTINRCAGALREHSDKILIHILFKNGHSSVTPMSRVDQINRICISTASPLRKAASILNRQLCSERRVHDVSLCLSVRSRWTEGRC